MTRTMRLLAFASIFAATGCGVSYHSPSVKERGDGAPLPAVLTGGRMVHVDVDADGTAVATSGEQGQ